MTTDYDVTRWMALSNLSIPQDMLMDSFGAVSF